jgi:hypothetical protein
LKRSKRLRDEIADVSDMDAASQFEEFERALAARLTNLTEDQILAVKEFVQQVGGIESARLVIESLEKLKPAA